MNAKIKLIHSQDAGLKISPKKSGETSLNLSTEILEFITDFMPERGEDTSISFLLYKEDFLRGMSYVITNLPLYRSSSRDCTKIDFSENLFNELYSSIQEFFEGMTVKLYNVNILRRTDSRIYLNNLKIGSFSIRNFLIEDKSVLMFSKDEQGKNIIRLDIIDNLSDDIKDDIDDDNFSEDIEPLLPLQQIYYGAPGTGKSHIINELTRGEEVIRTTFHPDSDYSTFVGAYKPTTKKVCLRDMSGHIVKDDNGRIVEEDKIIYEFVEQAFIKAYIKAWEAYANVEDGQEPKKQFLVIEEINRGNCAQIFGDLFQLLDRNDSGFSDYPIQADNDMEKQIKKHLNSLVIPDKERINSMYSQGDIAKDIIEGKKLLFPNNLYIWATMNTSDQSLFPIDSAFKRRWDWQYMPISQGRDKNNNLLDWKIAVGERKYDWWKFVETINEKIDSSFSEDKKLGFFFCKAKDGEISAELFVSKVIFYLWNDVFKDYELSDSIFNDDTGKLNFRKFYKIDENGKTAVEIDKVQKFLENLGLEYDEPKEETVIENQDIQKPSE